MAALAEPLSREAANKAVIANVADALAGHQPLIVDSISLWKQEQKAAKHHARNHEAIEAVTAGLLPLLRDAITHGQTMENPGFATWKTREELMLLRNLAWFVSGRMLRCATDITLDSVYSLPRGRSSARRVPTAVRSAIIVARCVDLIGGEADAQAKARLQSGLP